MNCDVTFFLSCINLLSNVKGKFIILKLKFLFCFLNSKFKFNLHYLKSQLINMIGKENTQKNVQTILYFFIKLNNLF